MATLFMVATPIGNLEDITYRAIETLKSVDIIACEDTRQSLKLLNHYGIKKHLISVRARNEKNAAPGVLKLMNEGKDVAYISDAGTPVLSDPGSILIRTIRASEHTIVPIPGPNAFGALISVSGFIGKTVTFEGFLPQKSGKRKKRLQELLEREESFIIYESPYRVVKLLLLLAEINSERQLLLGREMTKSFEEIIQGSVAEVLENMETRATIKGEFAILVAGKE
ncbi:MAG: 16S rRNA (cytidine(1402)-2'-O)-methyltransferase [Spirochaetaceae bacterium 4572_7]|nr:MAG: 16S rRNA (cytidine(1402)-2'-O)-methyltransferase [Spirochaetaceae bacterium 4572_7]